MSAKRKQSDKVSKSRSAAPDGAAPESTRSRSTTKGTGKGAGKGTAKNTTKGTTRAKPAGAKPDQMPAEVLEFIQAIDTYKRLNQRPFPNWSEILEILKELGYEKSLT